MRPEHTIFPSKPLSCRELMGTEPTIFTQRSSSIQVFTWMLIGKCVAPTLPPRLAGLVVPLGVPRLGVLQRCSLLTMERFGWLWAQPCLFHHVSQLGVFNIAPSPSLHDPCLQIFAQRGSLWVHPKWSFERLLVSSGATVFAGFAGWGSGEVPESSGAAARSEGHKVS